MEGTMAEVRLFGGNFAPMNWAFCDGSTIAISQNTALYSLLGTTYGGDGKSTFALPDLRGRLPIGTGNSFFGPVNLGDKYGQETQTMTINTMPAHIHVETGSSGEPSQNVAASGALATNGRGTNPPMPNIYAGQLSTPVATGMSTGLSGNGQPFPILQPFAVSNFIICTQGVFPSRN